LEEETALTERANDGRALAESQGRCKKMNEHNQTNTAYEADF
jgi:hypothetical protein